MHGRVGVGEIHETCLYTMICVFLMFVYCPRWIISCMCVYIYIYLERDIYACAREHFMRDDS